MTSNLDDGYMGSGKIINRAFEKYGLDNFKKDILEFFDTSEAMYAREKEIVTDEFLLREDVYNLRRGGTGGFDYINKTSMNNSVGNNIKAGAATALKYKEDEEFRIKISKDMSERMVLRWKDGVVDKPSSKEHMDYMLTKSLDPIAIEKRKETFAKNKHQQGSSNSQFGTIWITDGIVNKKIKKDDTIPEGFYRGSIRKKKVL